MEFIGTIFINSIEDDLAKLFKEKGIVFGYTGISSLSGGAMTRIENQHPYAFDHSVGLKTFIEGIHHFPQEGKWTHKSHQWFHLYQGFLLQLGEQ